MSILFVLLMFLLIISISYFRRPQEQPKPEVWVGPKPLRMQSEYGFSIPEEYCFHPGHTWVSKESPENARVGIDSFAGTVLGKIDRAEVVGPNRWVRQGQKLLTVVVGGIPVEMLSPVEGVVTAINEDVIHDPGLMIRDPYKNGWVAVIKSPDLAVNQKNLVQGPMVAPWMQNNVTRLNAMIGQMSPALAQDGGLPVGGVISRLSPEMRQAVLKEFFLA